MSGPRISNIREVPAPSPTASSTVSRSSPASSMPTALFGKDIQIITDFAGQLGAPTPLFSLASVFHRAALAQGRGEEDLACLYAVLDQLASVDGRAAAEVRDGH